MQYTLRTTLAVGVAVIVMTVAGCHSSGDGHAVTVNGERGKVYQGSAGQVSSQMGQDYAAGMRDMASQQAAVKP